MAPENSDRRVGRQPARRYVALIGDVVGSRELEDRAGVQRQLRELLAELNRELDAAVADDGPLAAELAVTAGDEVQGLLARPEAAVDVLVRLADALHPVRLAWGVGAGELETDLQGDVSLLDGPCFHRARTALERAAKDGAWARVAGLEPSLDRGLSALFRLVGAVREGWTDTQARYVRAVRSQMQKDVAEQYGVSPSVVSESLAAARYRDVREAEEAARELLARFASKVTEEAPEVPEPERELNPAPGLPGGDLA